MDATPSTFGAYCINLFENKVHFYSLPLKHQRLCGNSSDFEMTNLLCALLLWSPLIVQYKKCKIYTDNNAILGHTLNAFVVHGYLRHLQHCKAVQVLNIETMYINSREDYNKFQKYIEPADFLSRRRIDDFVETVHQSHGQHFVGEYCIEEDEGGFQSVRFFCSTK